MYQYSLNQLTSMTWSVLMPSQCWATIFGSSKRVGNHFGCDLSFFRQNVSITMISSDPGYQSTYLHIILYRIPNPGGQYRSRRFTNANESYFHAHTKCMKDLSSKKHTWVSRSETPRQNVSRVQPKWTCMSKSQDLGLRLLLSTRF